VVGRWWSVDPVDEFNTPFGYVSNNAISKLDPDGKNSEKIGETNTEVSWYKPWTWFMDSKSETNIVNGNNIGQKVSLTGDIVAKVAKAKVIFVNGMGNDKWQAIESAERTAAMTGSNVVLVHNPTSNIVGDLIECALLKFGFNNAPVGALISATSAMEQHYQNFTLIAHSEGTLVATNASPNLSMSKIDYKTYGNASWRQPTGFHSISHMVNPYDPIPLLFGTYGFLRSNVQKTSYLSTHNHSYDGYLQGK